MQNSTQSVMVYIYLQSVPREIWTCKPAVAMLLSSSDLNLILPVLCRDIFSSDCSHLLWRSSTTSFVKPLQLPTFHTSPLTISFPHNLFIYSTLLICVCSNCVLICVAWVITLLIPLAGWFLVHFPHRRQGLRGLLQHKLWIWVLMCFRVETCQLIIL